MKIFIIYASAGFGHKIVAQSLNEAAIPLYGNNNVKFLDILDFTPYFFKFLYSKGYIFLISRLKWFWAFLFFISNTNFLKPINNYFRHFINSLFCLRFLNFIKKEQPDVIISTHFLVNELVALLKQRKQINTKFISIVTDFGVHNFWIEKNVDTYIAACQETKHILISKGISKEKIKVLGIPIRKQFQKQMDDTIIRNKLGLRKREFTVLILTGGIGIGPIYQIVRYLEDRVNVIVICGNNRKLYNRLNLLNYKNLVVLGWIDYIEEAMKISDIIITKPGGSTISECLFMGLVMIFFSIIPGQEHQNAQIINNSRSGFILKKPKEIRDRVLHFKDNPEEIDIIRNRIKLFSHRDSVEKILELING